MIEGSGRLTLLPAFFDPHVHLRSPGQEHKEDIHSGTRAAAAGDTARCSPCPTPTRCSIRRPSWFAARCGHTRSVHLCRLSCRDHPNLQGEQLTEMAELRQEGALGFTDDGRPVQSAGMLRKALQYQRLCGGVLALHEEDESLSSGGSMHEGVISAALGLGGIPTVSESTRSPATRRSPGMRTRACTSST